MQPDHGSMWCYRVKMRQALSGLSRFLCTPRVAEHRLFVWLDANTLPDSATIAFAREDDYFFGVMHSRAHELWSLRQGTWLGAGNDLRYTPETCFNTFPFPEPSEVQRKDIAEAARALDERRRNRLLSPGNSERDEERQTLTELYNQRPAWLANAHEELDRAVFTAYGWPSGLSDNQVLANLLALNLEGTD